MDVWSASLDVPAALGSRLAGYLSADERARADRFVWARHRERFITARAFLRLLLARYADAPPRQLRFCYGRWGKPSLAESGDLRFNLSHSGGIVVCALDRRCGEIGVDVERSKPIGRLREVARVAFSPAESARLESLPEAMRLRAFYETWTRKEAVLKALGCGLDRPPGGFDAALEAAERFSLLSFEPQRGYLGAVAASGEAWSVRQLRWRWDEPTAWLPA